MTESGLECVQVIWIRRMRVLRRMLQKYRDADKVDKYL